MPATTLHLWISISEVVSDARWLGFLDEIPVQGETLRSPRLGAARGRLALLEGHYEEAFELLRQAESDRRGGLLLDAWHLGRALAEAEFRAGDRNGAERRLASIVLEAEHAVALLAANLGRGTAIELGLRVAAAPSKADAPSPRAVTGERIVSVLFADVRGYSELSAQTTPADLADKGAAPQRWATREVGRRNGTVDKFAGDAIMATFTISGQSVDHAVEGVRAGLAIIDKAALPGLPVGAGVAVGPAVVGNLAEAPRTSASSAKSPT